MKETKRLVSTAKSRRHVAAAFFSLALGVAHVHMASNAHAEDKVIGIERDWAAVTFEENGQLVCYIVSRPTKSAGEYTKRGPVYVQVTRRAGEPNDVVSFQAGYAFNRSETISAKVDGKAFELYTDGRTPETAWAIGDEGDRALVGAMRDGGKLVIIGVSSRGTATTDTYSLLGFTKAHAMIREACQ